MFSKLVILVVVSVFVVFFPAYGLMVMNWILQFHAYVVDFLAGIFSDGQVGHIIRDLLGLVALPVLIGVLFALVYWIARRKLPSFFASVVWSVWLLQLGALLVVDKL